MRIINEIIIHCSATPEGRETTVDEIRSWHLARGFSDIGYHYVIQLDGTISQGRPIEKMGAHCKGKNRNSIGICYIGGCSKDNKYNIDTRTDEQRKSLESLVNALKIVFNIDKISGHNQYSGKDCPCFNVTKEFN